MVALRRRFGFTFASRTVADGSDRQRTDYVSLKIGRLLKTPDYGFLRRGGGGRFVGGSHQLRIDNGMDSFCSSGTVAALCGVDGCVVPYCRTFADNRSGNIVTVESKPQDPT